MNFKQILSGVVFSQAHFSRAFMARHRLSPQAFLNLDKEKDIIGFLRDGYELFHLTGDENVLEQLDAYVYG